MLKILTIESFAIMDKVNLDFSKGMTVLSGETGAGKSIIIDALGILCGGRGANEFIRKGEDKLLVEGLFTFEKLNPALVQEMTSLGLDTEELLSTGLIIRREINTQGKNMIRVNGQMINVSQLKLIGRHLVDIHGQNEHQALLDNSQHLALIDQLGKQDFISAKEAYAEAYEAYAKVRNQWLAAQKNEKDQVQRLNFLEFQLAEIEAANLVPEEYQALEAMSKKLQNASKIAEGINAINYLLTDSDQAVVSNLSQAIGHLASLTKYDDQYSELLPKLKLIQEELQDHAHTLALSGQAGDLDDQSIDEVESRLDQLDQLKRKFGMDIDEILTYYQEISEEIYQIRHRESYLRDLAQALNQAYQTALAASQDLSDKRQTMAGDLVTAIEKELQDLYMPQARFKVDFSPLGQESFDLDGIGKVNWQVLGPEGKDMAEFYAMTNVGEAFKPLVKVASGGELSRFMLALKTVFSRQASPFVMVFDEIDSGVSGRVAQAIAEKIAQVGQIHQVLCITHLAQVAAIANYQLLIQKRVKDERTFTQVDYLEQEGRQQVLAGMIAGKTVTASSRELAAELLQEMTPFRPKV
ncbi:TPA: DNA repair protein RecN [Streptococcus suis]